MKLFASARPLTSSGVARDALAALTLASVNIPQVLGYTRIAGTHVVTGLYTLLLPLVITSSHPRPVRDTWRWLAR